MNNIYKGETGRTPDNEMEGPNRKIPYGHTGFCRGDGDGHVLC